MTTPDGGVTWSRKKLGVGQFNDVFFLDSRRGWLIGNGPASAWRTQDAGRSWTQMSGFPAGTWYGVRFLSANFGWAVGNGPLALTSDGGKTWRLAKQGAEWIQRGEFVSTSYGVGVGKSGLWATTDGGASWRLAMSASRVGAVGFFNPTTIVANVSARIRWSKDAGRTWSFGPAVASTARFARLDAKHAVFYDSRSNSLTRSSDGGRSWTVANFGTTQPVQSVIGRGGQAAFALTVRGDILLTLDAGANWRQVFRGPGVPLWSVARASSTRFFAGGSGGVLLRSEDAGATWRYVSTGINEKLTDIQMWDSERGVATGLSGFVLRTRSGGDHWLPSRPGHELGGVHLNAVSTLPGGFAAAVGFGPTMIRTHDYGVTWQRMPKPPIQGIGRMNDIVFVNAKLGWIAGGASAFILHTKDGGSTWSLQKSLAVRSAFAGIDFASTRLGLAVGPSHWLVRTTDGGASWKQVSIPASISSAKSDVKFVNEKRAWICGGFGYIARSDDGGATWARQSSPVREHLEAIHVVRDNEAWISGRRGTILHTTDGGKTWRRVDTGLGFLAQNDILAIYASSRGDVFAAGTNGNIIHREPTARFVPFGQACAGSAGVALLSARRGSRPLPGTRLALVVAPVPARSALLGLIGSSRDNWASLRLPIALDRLGMRGCSLNVGIDAIAAIGYRGDWTIPIPNDRRLAGAVLFVQALVVDRAANSAGLITSNGGELRVGSW